MPFALVAIGLLLVIAAYNNTQGVLGAQLKQDFSGSQGFLVWVAAIVLVGAIGYVRPLQTASRAVLVLILVVVFLVNKNVFASFNQAIAGSAGTQSPAPDGMGDPSKVTGTLP